MNNLVNMLASVRSTNDHFIEHLDRIQGYTEEEILKIEKYHNISVHGQLKELLLVMGKSSGGLLFGDDFYIYRDIPRNGLERQIALMNDVDPTIRFLEICGVDDLVEKQFFEICGENEHMNLFFMFTKDITDDVYEWDENYETVKKIGTLFEYLIRYRKNIGMSHIGGTVRGNENEKLFGGLTRGNLVPVL